MKIRCVIWQEEGYCFYTSGHVDKATFLAAARASDAGDIPDSAWDCYTPEDVNYEWFRNMTPYEAKSLGYDSGVMPMPKPEKRKRGAAYPVTSIIV